MNELFEIRNATTEDYAEIFQFFTKTRVKFFGEYHIKYLSPEVYFNRYITHRLLIRISDNDGTIIGYAELNNSPYIPALAEDCWLDWIQYHYCTGLPLNAVNTYFFNTFVFHPDYVPAMLRQLIEEFYFRENKIRYIVTAQCPEYGLTFGEESPMYAILEKFSHIYYPKCFSAITCPNTQCLYIMFRDDMISTMRYRLALPEDNDDIVEIVHADRPEMKQILGEYYIAEELLSTATKSVLIITEIDNITAGFVWLNGEVDIFPLLINYQLDMFGNLIKFDPKEKFREKNLYIAILNKNPAEKLFTKEAIHRIYKRSDSTSSMNQATVKADNDRDYKKFLRRCRTLNENLMNVAYYYKVQNLDHAFRYNVPVDQENYPYDAHRNVFAVQLFGLIRRHDPRRIFSFLSTAFTAFPDCDYCLLSVSITMRISPALFEMLKYFLRINPRPGCTNDEHLYIIHRSAVFGDIIIRPLNLQDLSQIISLMVKTEQPNFSLKRSIKVAGSFVASRISLTTNVREMVEASMSFETMVKLENDAKIIKAIMFDIINNSYSEYQCYVIKCGDSTKSEDENTVVGFAIIRPFYLNMMLKKHFLMPKFDLNANCMQAELVALKLHPFYHFQSDLVFRELARQSHYNHFVYFRPSRTQYLCNDLLTYMQPIEPRHIKKVWFCDFAPSSNNYMRSFYTETHGANLSGTSLGDFALNYAEDRYALFTHNLCPSLYFGNTTNIVIIGFSNLCKAFLRLILFGWHQSSKQLTTNNFLPHVNITVISEPGIIEAEYDLKFRCEHCTNDDDCYVNFSNNCAFIRDTIDRLDLRIWTRFISGDVTSISPSKQLIHMSSGCTVYYEYLLLLCETDFGTPSVIEELPKTPANYIEINSRLDKIMFYHKLRCLQHLQLDIEHSIIVYGNHIRAFEFINFLLKHGVLSKEIIMVLPLTKLNSQFHLTYNCCEYDTCVEEVLCEMIEDSGVKLYKRAVLKNVQCHNSMRELKCATFDLYPNNELVTIRCDFFVCFEAKYLRKRMAHVLERSGIRVRNYQVLVDEVYKTSAPSIYALGKCIKHMQEPNHQYHFVSPIEAATKLIVFMKWNNEPLEIEDKYGKPVYFQAQLPMNYFMAKVTIPKRYLARHLNNEYGIPMTTYKDYEFCRVRLNTNNVVEEILVVTQKTKDLDFLKFFCGQHEQLLNNMKSRWFMEEIDNFVEYFQQPWTELIMNDYFEDLQEYNKQLMMGTAEEIIALPIARDQRYTVMENYAQDFGITSRMEEALLLFIREHRADFHNDIALPEDFTADEPRGDTFF